MLLEMRIGTEMGKDLGMAVSCWLFAFVKGLAKHNEVREKQAERRKGFAICRIGTGWNGVRWNA